MNTVCTHPLFHLEQVFRFISLSKCATQEMFAAAKVRGVRFPNSGLQTIAPLPAKIRIENRGESHRLVMT